MRTSYRGIVLCPYTCLNFNEVDWVLLAKKAEINLIGIHSGGGGFENKKLVKVVENMVALRDGGNLVQQASESGVNIEYELHAISTALLSRHYFKQHPEWFIYDFRKGGRTPSFNCCPSSKVGLKFIGGNARALVKRFPATTGRYFLWSDDASYWCHCTKCFHFTNSDQEMMMMNKLLQSIRKDQPTARLAYLAYSQQMEPPQAVKPDQGIFLEYAPSARCYLHAINDQKCSVNRKAWSELLALLKMFKVEETHVLEYWLDLKRRFIIKPQVIRADIKAYNEIGIHSITTFVTFNPEKPFSRANSDALNYYGSCFA